MKEIALKPCSDLSRRQLFYWLHHAQPPKQPVKNRCPGCVWAVPTDRGFYCHRAASCLAVHGLENPDSN